MNITIINDCKDANVVGRQLTRTAALTGGQVSFVGVNSDIEAAGNLIDVLDAFGENEGCILANVAPRNDKAKKWGNGTPFGYFWYKKILVVASIDGFTLSLVKKLALTSHINVMDIPEVLDVLIAKNELNAGLKDRIANSQFRSFDFLPRIGAFLIKNKEVVSKKYDIKDVAQVPAVVWWVDNFGNCKTTLLAKDVLLSENQLKTPFGTLPYVARLKDVADGQAAIITGSSGIDDQRFLEIVVQGKSAASQLGISVGSEVM